MDLDSLKAISEIVGSLTTQAVLLYWVYVERKRFETIFGALIEDWKRQRDREAETDNLSHSRQSIYVQPSDFESRKRSEAFPPG